MQRQFLTTVLASLIIFIIVSQGKAWAEEPTILLDGWQLKTDTAPIIIDGRTMVPFRAIAQRLGVRVDWDGPSQTVTAWGEDKYISLQIKSQLADVNGKKVELDVPAQIINGRTLVPLRFFSEAFGAKVAWNGETRTVMVQSPPQPTYTLGFYAIRSFQQYQYLSRFNGAAFGWSRLDAQGALVLDGRDFYWPMPAGEITPQSIVLNMVGQDKDGYLMVYAGETGVPASTQDKRLISLKQPVGVVAAITPWNFPAAMITRKIAPALAAGCTCILKPAEQTPLTAVKLFELLDQADLPKGVANLVTGDPVTIGKALMQDLRVKKITFTGSTEVGKY